MPEHNLHDVVAAINAAKRIVITAHVRPDGDAIGSALGLHHLLKHAGRHSVVASPGDLSARYAFMVQDCPLTEADTLTPEDTDLLIVLDTGALDRAPEFVAAWIGNTKTLNIDHHPTNTAFADINYVDASASSTGEIICALATTAGFVLSTEAAEALWVALLTDTGRFAHSNTTPAALRAGAMLAAAGIRTSFISHQLFELLPHRQLQLQGRAIEHLELHQEGRLALVSLSREDFQAFEAKGEDADEVVSIPRRLDGVEVALFLYELPDEEGSRRTKVSFRTVEPFDAAQLCRSLGGGGHARAAGCSLDLPLAEAKASILDIINQTWFST